MTSATVIQDSYGYITSTFTGGYKIISSYFSNRIYCTGNSNTFSYSISETSVVASSQAVSNLVVAYFNLPTYAVSHPGCEIVISNSKISSSGSSSVYPADWLSYGTTL